MINGKNLTARKKSGKTKDNAKYIIPAAVTFTALLFTGCASTTSSAAPDAEAIAAASEDPGLIPDSPPSFTVTPVSNDQHTIVVNSSEKVTVIPDIAEVVYAVRTEAKDAATCQQNNTEDVNQVIALLKSLGIAESSVQTSDYYMYPIYNYSNNTQRITGYEATTTLTVSSLPIDNLGSILAESVNAGINNIQSITYQSGKYDEGYAEALRLAVESAKNKASVLAQAGGCSIGGIANIRENSNYSEARYTDNALASQIRGYGAMKQAAMEEDTAGIMPGEVDIEVNITVEYFIQ